MSPLQANISEIILPELEGNSNEEKWQNCAREYPWYPLPWLMLAQPGEKEACQKAGLWFRDEQRFHWLLHAKPWQQDNWLTERLARLKESPGNELDETLAEINQPAVTDSLEQQTTGKEIPENAAQETSVDNDNTEASTTKASLLAETEAVSLEVPDSGNLPGGEAEAAPGQLTDISPEPASEEQRIISQEQPATKKEDTQAAIAPILKVDKHAPVEKPITGESSTSVQKTGAAEGKSREDENGANEITDGSTALPKFKIDLSGPAETETALPAFEPYHSVDYFASQGIKLEQVTDAEPKDKFDRQLKSFTQWLKTMKRVAPVESEIKTDPEVEVRANQSVSGREVITETMAQVLEKQGKFQKALEVYEKLLLLHPEKSAFFAAQIEELKNKQ